MAEKAQTLEVIFDKCPVCKKGKVSHISTKKFFGLMDSAQIKCDHCNAIFIEQDGKEDQRVFELDLSESKAESNYNGQALKMSEWKRGLSDLDFCIKNNSLPNLTVMGLKVVLEEGERTHWYSSAVMMEERAVRNYQSYRVKGYSFGNSESHGELRRIDKGNLLLTNKRIIFNGDFKHLEYKLDKVMALEEFKDSFEIGVSNRQKLQTFLVDEPHKWVVYTKIALSKIKSKGKSEKNVSIEVSSTGSDATNIKQDLKKAQESLAKMKEQLVKIQEKKKNGKK